MKQVTPILLFLVISNSIFAGDAGLIGYLRIQSLDKTWAIEGEHIDGDLSKIIIKGNNGKSIEIDISKYALITYPKKNESIDNQTIIISGAALDLTKPEDINRKLVKLIVFRNGKYKFEYK